MDLGFDAWERFYQSHDDPKDTAEDLSREMMDRREHDSMGFRVFLGKVRWSLQIPCNYRFAMLYNITWLVVNPAELF